MEKKMTLPAYPLITHDPHFSIWDCNYTPTGGQTRHWSGAEKRLLGTIWIDGKQKCFLGDCGRPNMPMTLRQVTPLSTRYCFEADGIRLTLTFTSPLLPGDLEILSTPITYVRFKVEFCDGEEHQVSLQFTAYGNLCYSGEEEPKMRSDAFADHGLNFAYLGKEKQSPLNGSGDHLTCDWGYLFFAAREGVVENPADLIGNALRFNVAGNKPFESTLLIGYDDIASIRYFTSLLPGYWARKGKTIVEALRDFSQREAEILSKCEAFDRNLLADARELGGEEYALLISASYRQSVAAHKLVADPEGNVLFISKENDSNGCAATVDVSYPSVPLYLLYCPELVRGMLRPVFRFARMGVWKYDFAPHDVGRYPILTGQVYGAKCRGKTYGQGDMGAPYYLYPATVDAYLLEKQMPVEECGNMLLMVYAVCYADGNWSLARENADLLAKWNKYLLEFGADPENQLCTDDFAGHLARNVNLSAKAVMGIRAYAEILSALGQTEESKNLKCVAEEMAKSWLRRADAGTHTALTFDGEGWSQKYNLVWDKIFSWKLLPDSFYEKELASYLGRINEFGLPLDSRATYTKSDWSLWVASMAEDTTTFKAFVSPIAHFLQERRSAVPFTDFYDTVDGTCARFIARSVQGGIFMPLLRKKWKK